MATDLTFHKSDQGSEIANPFTGKGIANVQRSGSIAETQIATKEVAEVQARVFLAKQFPRDQANACERILTACQRPSLANSAIYSYPVSGMDVSGPSIRLAEEIVRSWGNIDYGWNELERNSEAATLRAYAWDLETNAYKQIVFGVPLQRTSRHSIKPLRDEREIYNHLANYAVRRMRNCVLALIPDDVVEAAVEQCRETQLTNLKLTPERIKEMVAVFGSIGVSKVQLEAKFQRKIESIQPAQFVSLQRIYNSIRDGMSSPSDWFEPESAKETTADAIKKLLKKPAGEKAVPASESESDSTPTTDGSEKLNFSSAPPKPQSPEPQSPAPQTAEPPKASLFEGKAPVEQSVFDNIQSQIVQTKIRGRLTNLLERVKVESTTGELTEEQVSILFKLIDVRDQELNEEQGK